MDELETWLRNDTKNRMVKASYGQGAFVAEIMWRDTDADPWESYSGIGANMRTAMNDAYLGVIGFSEFPKE